MDLESAQMFMRRCEILDFWHALEHAWGFARLCYREQSIKPPHVATKMAILEAKADVEGITLTEDVRSWIATMSGDVRALKAALLKLLAYSSLTGEPIDLEMAQQLIWWPPRRPFRFL
jgi:hypothetical protein